MFSIHFLFIHTVNFYQLYEACTVEPLYDGVLGAMEVALCRVARVSHCIRVEQTGNMGGWGVQGGPVVGGVLLCLTSL